MKSFPRILSLLVLVGLVGCSGSDGSIRDLEAAAADVDELRLDVEDAQAVVDERRAEVGEAQEALDDAIEALRETQGRLNEAEHAIAEMATDDVLFRSVQARLIEELDDAAVAARVRDGVVTLTGRVDDPDLRDIAEQIAAETLGVLSVDNRVEVSSDEG